MSQVAPQVDVGTLTLNGLAAFAPVLAVLSADDVTPLAIVQMENLGSLFHINGKYALQVPDLLQRCKSTRLDRLGLLLVQVAKTLSSKLEVLGFGNIVAAQVVRIYDAYKHFGKSVPDNFLDKIAPGDMAELLHAMTRAVREESIVVRITGSRSMGHILAIVTIMFPKDAFVTMENMIVFEGLRKSVLVEFTDSDGTTNVQLESKLQIQSTVPILPIEKHSRIPNNDWHGYCYNWTGCMADMLQVMFMEDGLISPEPLRVACCGMLEPLAKAFNSVHGKFDATTGPLGVHGTIKMLGPYPHERIDQICQKLWRIPPGWAKPALSLKNAFDNLLLAFAEATLTVSCTCEPQKRCFTSQEGWSSHRIPPKMQWCPLYRSWKAVGETIVCGFGCLFVNADDGATIVHPMDRAVHESVPGFISDLLYLKRSEHTKRRYDEIIHRCIMSFCGSTSGVGASSNSSTVYMAALQTPLLPNTMNAQFILMEGQLIFNGRYHTLLTASESERPEAQKNIHQGTQPIIPSSAREHSSLDMTIREGIRSLELTLTTVIGGGIVHLNLRDIIPASWELHEAEPCEHSAKTPLEPRYEDAVFTTSVASPLAIRGKISIVQVSRNPVAQLLSCVKNTRLLL
ncbi:hypothetical protein VE00_10888 [Pseudogymnoascus sp. WSF 3629]|nr:hypothetical protein VE00_10888 [Pseudogymnoascus sp. WSF 3629]